MSNTVPEGWVSGKFGDLARVQNGYAFKSSDFSEQGHAAAIRMSNLKKGRIDLSDAKYVPERIVEGLDQFRLSEGDFLFGMSGSLENYGWVTSDTGVCYLNQRVGCLRAKPKSDSLFTAYCYLSETVKREIVGLAAGAAQLNISGSQLEAIPVPIPPLPEQQKIAAILSSVDDVIEKTRAQIDKLKDLKTGMMQELLTKGIGHTEFKDSPLGRIPENWAVVPLSEIVQSKVLGTTLRGQGDQNVLLLKMGNLLNGEVVYSKREWVSYSSEIEPLLLEHGDLLFNTRNTPELVGKSANYVGKSNPVTYDNNLLRLRFYNSMNSFFVGYFLNLPTSLQSLAQLVSGTTSVAAIYWKDMASLLISVPPKVEQDQIVATIGAISAKIDITTRKIADLRQLKKALMQDLLTGKVRVNVDQKESAVA